MKNQPLVSVIIPSYNRTACIQPAIESVLNQTYRHLELIIVDDGSTDNTRQVVEAIADPRLRYVYQDNAGACAARNRGIDEAKGDFIAFHDSDDLWYPKKLEKQMDLMDRTGADLIFCKLAMRKGQEIQGIFPKYIQEGFVAPNDDIFGIGTQTILTRRMVTDQERFDPAMPRYQDFEWLFRVLRRYQVYCLDEALVDYIIGEDSISRNSKKIYIALKLFYNKYGSTYKKECPLIFMHIVRNLAEAWIQTWGKKTNSAKYLSLILKYYPGMTRFLYAYLRKRQEKLQRIGAA